MEGDENDMIPVKDMNDKEKYSRSMFHDKDSSIAQERAGINKLSREELEDRHLRLLEENQILKKHCHKQEDKIKRLATKLLRLVQDRKKSGERQRDPETNELIQSQQDRIQQMERQLAQLKDKLLVARQQAAAGPGRPGRSLLSKADLLRRQSSRPSSKTSSQRRQPAAGEPPLPAYAEQLLLEAREAAAQLQQQSAALTDRNRQLEETLSTLREQCNMYEQELELLKEQSRVKELEHEEEVEVLRNQAIHANRAKLAENVGMIKLQRELKQTASKLSAVQAHAQTLEETLRTEKPIYERSAREIAELNRLYEDEQRRCQQLQREAAAAVQARQQLDELETSLRDAQKENELLRTANQKLSDIQSDQGWQREQQAVVSSLRAQLATAESTLRGEQARCRQLADQLTAEQQRSCRLQAETCGLQTQLMLRPTVAPPVPSSPSQPTPRPRPRLRVETRDQAVGTSPRPEPSPSEAGEEGQSILPQLPDSPASELIKKIDNGEPVHEQLASLHCQYVETIRELEKTRTLLDVQKQINTAQQQEVALLTRRLAELGRARDKTEAELRSALEMRTARIVKLENKLREVVYRTPGSDLPRPAVMDSSMQLEDGSCLFELHVEQLSLTAEARRMVGDAGLFLTWIFYNQDMHYTPVLRGDLRFSCSSLYKLFLDLRLIHYLTNDHVTIELHQTEGASDCRRLGAASLSFREILDYPSNRLHGTAELADLGTLAYWFRADSRLEQFLRRPPPAASGAPPPGGETDSAVGGSGDQTIVAGSPDLCDQPAATKPGRGPAAVSTPVRRRLAARVPAAVARSGRHTSGDASVRGACSDSELSGSEATPERRSARRPPATQTRSEANLARSEPRPAARRQPASRGRRGNVSPPMQRAAAETPPGRRGRGRTDSAAGTGPAPPRQAASTPGWPAARAERGRRPGRGAAGSVGVVKVRSEPRPSSKAGSRQPPPPPAPRRPAAVEPSPPPETAESSQVHQPRGTGYATYTESSSSDMSSVGEAEPAWRGRQPASPPQKSPPPIKGRQLLVGISSASEQEPGSVPGEQDRSPPPPDRQSPPTTGRSPSPAGPQPGWTAGGDDDSGGGGSSADSAERTVLAAVSDPQLRVAVDVHRRQSAQSLPSTGSGTDSEGVVLHSAYSQPGQPPAADTVAVTVHHVTLSAEAEVYDEDGERPRLFVEYRFLDVPPEELESPHSLPLPPPGRPLVFNFRKVISVGSRDLPERRRLLAAQLRPDAPDRGIITFTVVAEPPDSADDSAECSDVGYAHLCLPDLLRSGRDLVESRLPLCSAAGDQAGDIVVSVRALDALRTVTDQDH